MGMACIPCDKSRPVVIALEAKWRVFPVIRAFIARCPRSPVSPRRKIALLVRAAPKNARPAIGGAR